MNDKKGYYAIIPATVRYDKNLSANAKLLYGEITALCNEKGYCWAKNDYFAELYGVAVETVSRYIRQLAENGYLRIEYKKRGAEITKRLIFLSIDCANYQSSNDEIVNRTNDENVKENNTSINNTNNIKENIKRKDFIPPTLEEIKAYIEEKKYNVNADTFFNYFDVSNWVDSQGKPVKNWKQKLITWSNFENNPARQKPKQNYSGTDWEELERRFSIERRE